ncbi:LOW QUALITY PROTEIN: fanconi-associated nuclease 1-like [Acipenser ruthenus]|uniref:LOW QUALITY PROTEIN: fanconi-associated nuclease 1-like n=1 Tax=Acipenser ruthenus TaxID=7906 RepID=UPI00274089CA|nr:LOW QUALITY PROTEIN: fanconi-associated nuclease 1-like [Acipenser ruthenus]
MSERNSPAKKRPRRSLSITKNKKSGKEVARPTAQKTASIVSFFNSTPPAKLACPMCGQMVPRFWINEHIDKQCQKFTNDDGDDVIFVNSVSKNAFEKGSSQEAILKSPRSPEKVVDHRASSSSSPNRDAASECAVKDKQASPYFKNDFLSQKTEECTAKVVRTIHLGCLASKLSRKTQRQNSNQHSKEALPEAQKQVGSSSEGTGDACALNSSLKENHCDEPLDVMPGCSSEDAKLRDLDMMELPSQNKTERRILTEVLNAEVSESSSLPLAAPASRQPVSVSRLNNAREMRTTVLMLLYWHTAAVQLRPAVKEGDPKQNQQQVYLQIVSLKPTNQDENASAAISSMEISKFPGSAETDQLNNFDTVDSQVDTGVTVKIDQGEGNRNLVQEASRLPYYLCNFLTVLQAVLENEDDRQLFSEDDIQSISLFQQLSAAGQKLYVRLFQRKLNWLKVNKLEYSEIGSDLAPVIKELVQNGFLQRESELQDISEVLELLSAPELKTLAKAFHLANPNGQKQQLVEGFLRLSRQRSLFSFSNKQPGTGAVILRRTKELAGVCVRVCKGPRAVFSRVLLLFSLSDSVEDEETGSGGQGQLYTVLMVIMGRMSFPDYTVHRESKVFQDREDLIRYETAVHMLNDVTAAMLNGHWDEANLLFQTAKAAWQELSTATELRCLVCLCAHCMYYEELPVYLRCFTAGWVYTRILSREVEILQRLRMNEEAVEELQNLLSQSTYCVDSRGRWWDRLALNLQQHLKRTEEAINCIKEGLSDPLVRTGHQLSLCQRAVRTRESLSCKKFRHLLKDVPAIEVKDVTHVTIRGKLCPHAGMGKSVFLMEGAAQPRGGSREEGDSTATVMCSVEELALAHYHQQGFDQGIHGEGSTFFTLCSLLMWDIIFMDGIADVFRNPYQACPLDLHTDCFYENRRESRLQLLQEASTETLQTLIADTWNSQHGKAAALVNWERFSSLQQAQSLAVCFGGPFLSGVMRRMCKDYRHCRGGLPDLVVWETQNNTYKLVEVKGPNDRLSHKQMIWLHELQQLGAEVEVCHVTAIGARSTRLT